MKEKKNCERKWEFKETMSIMAMMESVKLICRFGNRER
jgi:hypothetical protein